MSYFLLFFSLYIWYQSTKPLGHQILKQLPTTLLLISKPFLLIIILPINHLFPHLPILCHLQILALTSMANNQTNIIIFQNTNTLYPGALITINVATQPPLKLTSTNYLMWKLISIPKWTTSISTTIHY